MNKIKPMFVDAKEGALIDESTLRKKIDVLFDGMYTDGESRNLTRSRDGTKISAT